MKQGVRARSLSLTVAPAALVVVPLTSICRDSPHTSEMSTKSSSRDPGIPLGKIPASGGISSFGIS
jgi:hypothetical protein